MFTVNCLDIPHNLFGSNQLTGRIIANYHWLPSRPFIEVDRNGNPTEDQMLGIGSLVKNDEIYTVLDIRDLIIKTLKEYEKVPESAIDNSERIIFN